MKPLLIHCHIYYPQLWAELKQCILNTSAYPFELFVTMVEKHPEIEKDIKENFPKAHIEIVVNRGYDIGPFIHVLNKVSLDKYSYIIKLHTKRDVGIKDPFRKMVGSLWRESLLSPFKSHEIFEKYMKAFEVNPQIGMQANYKLIVQNDIYDKKAKMALKDFLKKHHLPKIKYAFVAGTMFIARAELFKEFQKLNIKLGDFPIPQEQKGEHISQLAHVMERLLGYFVYFNDKIIYDINASIQERNKYYRHLFWERFWMNTIAKFFFNKKITKHRFLYIKICKIPVYRRKV